MGSAHINTKEREKGKTSEKNEEKERDRGTVGKTPYSTPGAIDVLRGDEEQKEETSSGAQTKLPWTIRHSYDPQGGEGLYKK